MKAGWTGRGDALGASRDLACSALRSEKPNLDSVFGQPAGTPAFLIPGSANGIAGNSNREKTKCLSGVDPERHPYLSGAVVAWRVHGHCWTRTSDPYDVSVVLYQLS